MTVVEELVSRKGSSDYGRKLVSLPIIVESRSILSSIEASQCVGDVLITRNSATNTLILV